MHLFSSYLFQVKEFKLARAQVDSGTLVWTILISQKEQEDNLVSRLGVVSRLPQVSSVQQRPETGGSKRKKKNHKAQCHPCWIFFIHSVLLITPTFPDSLFSLFHSLSTRSSASLHQCLSLLAAPPALLCQFRFLIHPSSLHKPLSPLGSTVKKGPLTVRQSPKFLGC